MARRRRRAPDNLPRPRHWTDDARCRDDDQIDPNAFFVEDRHLIERAKAFCTPCPVQAECLAGALERREAAGVWGGLSTPERRAILTARRRAAERQAAAAEDPATPPGAALELVTEAVPLPPPAEEVSCAVLTHTAA